MDPPQGAATGHLLRDQLPQHDPEAVDVYLQTAAPQMQRIGRHLSSLSRTGGWSACTGFRPWDTKVPFGRSQSQQRAYPVGAGPAEDELWGGVREGAGHHVHGRLVDVRQDLGEADIADLGDALLRQQDVGRLQIPTGARTSNLKPARVTLCCCYQACVEHKANHLTRRSESGWDQQGFKSRHGSGASANEY